MGSGAGGHIKDIKNGTSAFLTWRSALYDMALMFIHPDLINPQFLVTLN